MNDTAIALPDDVSHLSNAELRKLENRIARQFSGKPPWEIVAWAFGNMFVWFAVWALVIAGIMPLWLGAVIATVNITLVYLPTHDAQHGIIARPGQKLRWLNELVGHATSWMIIYPFNLLRVTHLDHHRHTNDPELDPDIFTKAAGPWSALWMAIKGQQPNSPHARDYETSLERAGRQDLLLLGLVYQLAFMAILITLAWSGYALEAFFLWWLPLKISNMFLNFWLSWAPHHPGNEQGRYRNTRNWRSKVGNLGSMGMQYHVVHHLHPYIPLTKTPAAYRAMQPILKARGVEVEM